MISATDQLWCVLRVSDGAGLASTYVGEPGEGVYLTQSTPFDACAQQVMEKNRT
jgi:hypothetical protein